MIKENISFTLNGKPMSLETDPANTLLWVLRTELGLMGTKFGCGLGFCGACTVLIDEEPVRSCMQTAGDVAGRKVTTIEGLASDEGLHPIQQAFVDHDALQCGYCTPGMIMSAYGLLAKNPDPSEDEIIQGLENNLCRCAAHKRIVAAVRSAASVMKNKNKVLSDNQR